MPPARFGTHALSPVWALWGRWRAPAAVATLLLALALALPAAVRAQQPAPKLTITQVDSSGYPKLSAVVTVLDGNGIPVPGLQAAQFTAADENAAIPIAAAQSVQDADLKLSVVLAIDTSGSMAGAPLDGAKQAAIAFVNSLGPNDNVALIAFADNVAAPVAGFSGDHAALAAGIQSLQAGGSTVLYGAVQAAVLAARSSPAPRKAIVILSDGQNDTATSAATAAGALDTVRQGDVPVFTIGFGAQPDVNFLQSLSQASQGQYSAATTTNIADVYAGIGRLLRGQYVLTLTAKQPADGKPAQLRIDAKAAGAQAEGTASFTRGSAPAVAPVATVAQSAPEAATSKSSGSGSSTLLIAILVLAVLAVVGGGALLLLRRARAARAQREREREAGRQSDESVPVATGTLRGPDDDDHSRGRIAEMNGSGVVAEFDFGTLPLTIGSGPECAVRVAPSADVAPQHALIWAKGGKIMLRHVGGPRRRTLVGTKPVDWVILEDGDEFAVGPHRFRTLNVAVPIEHS